MTRLRAISMTMRFAHFTATLLLASSFAINMVCATTYEGGISTYMKDGKYGLKRNDVEMTPARFTEIGKESWNGFFMVEVGDSAFGMIDNKGKEVLAPVFDYVCRDEKSTSVYASKKGYDKNALKSYIFDKKANMFVENLSLADTFFLHYEKVDPIGVEDNTSIWYHYNAEIGSKNNLADANIQSKRLASYGNADLKDVLAYHVEKDGQHFIISKDKKTILADFDNANNYRFSYDRIFVVDNNSLVVIDAIEQKVIDKIECKTNDNLVELVHQNGQKQLLTRNSHLDSLNVRYRSINDTYAVPVKENGKWGMYKSYPYACQDKFRNMLTSDVVVPFVYDKMEKSIDDKICFFHIDGENGEYIYNCNGIYLMPGDFAGGKSVDRKLSRSNYVIIKKDDFCGVVSTEGKVIIPLRYANVENVRDAMFIVTDNSGKKGVINTDGKMVVPCSYDEINISEDGKMIATKDNNQYGLFNNSGAMLLPPEYRYVIFSDNNIVKYEDKDENWGLVSADGKVLPCVYYSLTEYGANCLVAQNQNGLYGLIDSNGSTILPFCYNFIRGFSANALAAQNQDKLCGMVDSNGAIVLPFVYKDIRTDSSCPAHYYIVVDHDNKHGLANEMGELVVPCIYEGIIYYQNEFWSELGPVFNR